MRPLSTVEADIQRSFEAILYKYLLHYGYIPDRKIYGSDPAKDTYKTAAAVITQSKGFCVALYGHGQGHDRDNLSVPRMVITGLGFAPGNTGTEFGPSYTVQSDGSFKKEVQGTPYSNYRIQVELISQKTSQDRFIESIRGAALPNLAYLDKWNDSIQKFLTVYTFTSNRPNLEYGLIHKVYTYEVLDVAEVEPVVVAGGGVGQGIVPIKEILVTDQETQTELVLVKSKSLSTRMTSGSSMKTQ